MDIQNRRTDSGAGRTLQRLPVDDLLADHHYLHWSTQLDHFITVRAGGTPYGMYKQALRELDKRERGLNGMYADRDRLLVDLEELEERLRGGRGLEEKRVRRMEEEHGSPSPSNPLSLSSSNPLSSFDRRRSEIDLRQKRFALSVCERSIRDHERERDRFIEQAMRLREVLGIDADRPLTPERRTALDREMWVFLLQRDAALELITRGAIEKNTLCMIMSLPQQSREPILSMIHNQVRHIRETGNVERGPLLDWYFAHEAPRLEEERVREVES